MSLKTRIEKLESIRGNSTFAVWREWGETSEQAIVRRFDGTPPANTKLFVISWMQDAEAPPAG